MTRLSRRSVLQMAPLGGAAVLSGAQAAVPVGNAPIRDLAKGPVPAVLDAGVYRVSDDLVIPHDIQLTPGAIFDVAAGKTLTITGGFSAPFGQVFRGDGRIDLNRARITAAYPEWFGALTDNGQADCLPAFDKCLAAHPVMHLRAADYWISDTFVIRRAFSRVWGAGYRGADQGQGTRIIVRSGSADVMRVGSTRAPATVNDYLQGVDVRWMELGRSQPVSPGPMGEPAGLRIRYVLVCQFEGLSSRESGIGFSALGAVRTYLRDCIAFRSIKGTVAGTWRGFELAGLDDIGLAGANGSLFINDCNASIGGQPGVTDSVGLLLEGGIADSFVTNFEATGLQTGIRIDGKMQAMANKAVSGHSNVHIRMPIIDQCGAVGLDVVNVSEHGLIDISDAYVAIASGAQAAIRLRDVSGCLTLVGGQLIGRSAIGNPEATGILCAESSGIDVQGLKISDFQVPISIQDCANITVQGRVHNPLSATKSAAISVMKSERLRFQLSITGKMKAFKSGFMIDKAQARSIVIDASLIDASVVRDGKVLVGGRQSLTKPDSNSPFILV